MVTLARRQAQVAEVSIWIVLSSASTLFRLTSQRIQRGGISKFRIDDWIMVFVFFFNLADGGAGLYAILEMNLLGALDSESSEEVMAKYIKIAHYFFVPGEMVFQLKLWLLKACLVILYWRLTVQSKLRHVVMAAGIYCIVSYLVVVLFLLVFMCRPFSGFWLDIENAPTSNCVTWLPYYKVQLPMNISSDLLIFCIPLALFSNSTLPWKRKILLCGIFSVGAIVILFAILNKVFLFQDSTNPEYVIWSYRECNLAVIVTNAPMCWTALRRIFGLKAFSEESSNVRKLNIKTGDSECSPWSSKSDSTSAATP
ncbi:hypothetical protein BP6252_01282 [Coleophoma cylindrospora]|uniref:Rhodopsin domain-containing protein n=1 Tax=Coleophoma cylindrospora TaxID=1849047 RepID=A0A3D8SSF3_9HELO|nr:hypothetical protein BP6252_01282 [Coleophoma cylindrospora]